MSSIKSTTPQVDAPAAPLSGFQQMAQVGQKKVKILAAKPRSYFVSSVLAGFYIGLGLLVAMIAGQLMSTQENLQALQKFAFSGIFGVGLTLVLLVGADLFTGTNMYGGTALFAKKIQLGEMGKLFLVCYLANFLGSLLMATLALGTSLSPAMLTYLGSLAAGKASASFLAIFVKGILCNILVCCGIWCYMVTKDKTPAFYGMYLCVFAFVLAGFEHSVANMTLFSMAGLVKIFQPDVAAAASYPTWAGMGKNLLACTLGNMTGGIGFVSYLYYLVDSNR